VKDLDLRSRNSKFQNQCSPLGFFPPTNYSLRRCQILVGKPIDLNWALKADWQRTS